MRRASLGVEQLGLDRLTVDRHCEPGDGRARWDGEDVGSFGGPTVGIVENLVDACRRHLVGNRDVDTMGSDVELIGDEDGVRTDGIAGGRVDDDDAIRAC